MDLQIEESLDGSAAILRLSGDLDVYGSPRLRSRLKELREAGSHVVVDLSAVKFIDASGEATFVEAFQRASPVGLRVVLCSLSKPVQKVLELNDLHRVLAVTPDVPSALAAVPPARSVRNETRTPPP